MSPVGEAIGPQMAVREGAVFAEAAEMVTLLYQGVCTF